MLPFKTGDVFYILDIDYNRLNTKVISNSKGKLLFGYFKGSSGIVPASYVTQIDPETEYSRDKEVPKKTESVTKYKDLFEVSDATYWRFNSNNV
jgi:hypothetical protein